MNRIIYKRLLSTKHNNFTNLFPKCAICVHYSEPYCLKSHESNTLNFINNKQIYDLAVNSRNNLNKCGNNGKNYEFIGPHFAIQKEKYLTIGIFMGLVTGATNIIYPLFTFIPATMSFLSCLFYFAESFVQKEMEKEEKLRIKLFKENEKNNLGDQKINNQPIQIHEYITTC